MAVTCLFIYCTYMPAQQEDKTEGITVRRQDVITRTHIFTVKPLAFFPLLEPVLTFSLSTLGSVKISPQLLSTKLTGLNPA